MSAAPRLVHLTCRRPSARLYQPQKPHRVQPASPPVHQQASQPASRSNKSIGRLHSIPSPCRQPSSRRMPTRWVRVSVCPCRPARAEVRQPPAFSRPDMQFPPPPAEREHPRAQRPRRRRRRRVRAEVTEHQSRAAAASKHHTTPRVSAMAQHPRTGTPGHLGVLGTRQPGQPRPRQI